MGLKFLVSSQDSLFLNIMHNSPRGMSSGNTSSRTTLLIVSNRAPFAWPDARQIAIGTSSGPAALLPRRALRQISSFSSVGRGSSLMLLVGPVSAIAHLMDFNDVALTDSDVAANLVALKTFTGSVEGSWLLYERDFPLIE